VSESSWLVWDRKYESALCLRYIRLTCRFSWQGKPETLGFHVNLDEIGYCYSLGDSGTAGKSHLTKSGDELGQLVQSFNTMVEGLKERDFISNTFGRYVDQNIAK
jgi:hypothetical protein